MEIALLGFALVLLLGLAGFPLGFATLSVGTVGFAFLRDWHWNGALTMVGQQVMETGSDYGLTVIPLFILMGGFIHQSNLSEDLFRAAYASVGHRKGGLAEATVLACAGFSAVSGSSTATAATMTKVALPQMRRYGYSERLSSGVIAAGGTLGIMIPPSIPLMVYALVAGEDIRKLFLAGMLPGLLLVLLFLGAVRVMVWYAPAAAPAGERVAPRARSVARAKVWPVVALFALVLGGIFVGAFTPTEAAGIGAFGAAAFALARGSIRSWQALCAVLVESCKTAAALFTVIFGALVFANFVSLSGLPEDLLSVVDDLKLGPTGVVIFVCLVCIFLGTVFEAAGLLLLVVPVFLPVLSELNIDLIWFGIVVVVLIEMALITPPIGMNVFTVRATAPEIRLTTIYLGVIPFLMAIFIALILLVSIPILSVGLDQIL